MGAGERIRLTEDVFAIDAAAWCATIEEFIGSKMEELRRDGIVVPVSGGLDSSVVAALCARAVGRDKVLGLMLPVRFGNPEALGYGKLLVRQLGIASMTVRMDPVLRGLGTSSPFIALISGREGWKRVVESNLARRGTSTERNYQDALEGRMPAWLRANIAKVSSINRARVAMTYKVAEERNLLVAGSSHRTEALVGLFIKYGIDDCADIMPLRNIHRSHSLRLAAHVGVPAEILARSPNPDIIPGVTDKYAGYFGMNAATIDLVLYGIGKGLDPEEIAGQLSIPRAAVDRVARAIALTEHCRNHSMAPVFEY